MTKARDIADFKFENIVDTGTEGTKIALGTTGQRGSTTGQIRFNSTTGLAEYYTGTTFKAIDAPPTVSSVGNTNITDAQISANYDLSVSGSGFLSGATVKFIGNDGTEYASPTVTVNSETSITARVPTTVTGANEPYDVKVTNISGLANTLADAFNVDAKPAWQTASGTLATINDNATGTHATVSATDPEGDTVSYSETGGTVLSTNNFSLNSSTGAISGDPVNVNTSTTHSFTLRATSGSNTTDRAFNIIVNPLADGSTSGRAASSATSIYNLDSSFQGSSANGLYWLDPDGTGTYLAQYYCRMDYGGGWVQVMNFVRENTGDNTYPLASSSARGTMPTNPYVTPSQQTKVHNTVISNLETAVNTSYYDILLHYFTYTGTYPATGSALYPSSGTTVASVSNGVHSDASGFASDIVQLRNSRKLSDAITDGTSGGIHNGTLNAHTRHVSGITSGNLGAGGWTGKDETDASQNSQMSDTNSAILNFHDEDESAATAYSTLCDDGQSGLYIIRRQFNCYHNYGILYVR